MRIIWALDGNCFEAVLTPGALWQKDLEAVKAAGFRASGPPDWRWQAMNVKAVMKLRANKPESGLTISSEALAKYTPQAEQEEKNEAVKKQFAEGRKAVKKEQKKKEVEVEVQAATSELMLSEKGYKDASDYPPYVSISKPFIPPDNNREYKLCSNCGDEVETFLYAETEPEPQFCIWCQKVLDKSL
jgi:hypothetical protein